MLYVDVVNDVLDPKELLEGGGVVEVGGNWSWANGDHQAGEDNQTGKLHGKPESQSARH